MIFIVLGLIAGWCFYTLLKRLISSDKSKETQNRRNKWITVIEPKHRNTPYYPQDWKERRKEVFLRAEGRCESCGKEVGKLAETSGSGMQFIEPQLKGAHVHHIQKLSEGGDHSLSNLQLLCESCHALKHPDKQIRGMISRGQLRTTRGRRTQRRKNHRKPT